MLSRALSLATVMLLIGCFAAKPAQAQAQNLEAGKSPSQIFAGTCNACHKSPRGLLKTVPAGSLPGFLRQHYTTSGEMASLLSAFLVSNGAADTRYVGAPPKSGKDAKPEAGAALPDHIDRFGRRVRQAPPAQEAAKPDAEPREAAKPEPEGVPPQGEPGRPGRNAKRLARPGEAPDATKPAAAEGQAPAQATLEHGPDGRKSAAKQKLSKRGKPGAEEPPKADAGKPDAAKEEAAKGDAAKDDKPKSEAARDEGSKPEGSKPSGEAKSESAKSESAKPESTKSESAKPESAKIEAPKEPGSPPVLRADPVPPVTPAPSASPAVSAAVSSGTPEPAAAPSAAPVPPPPAVTASVPPPPPAPAGPPAPPISQ